MPCAASPPSAFCQEKVTTSSLVQSSVCANAAEVASQMVRPCAVGRDPVGVRHAHARGGAVPGEHHVGLPDRPWTRSGKLAVRRLQHRHVLELELLLDVADPAFAERFPGQHGDRARRRAATTAPSRRRRCRRPARCRCDNPRALRSTSRVRSMARLSFALPILDRCERPRTASVRACRLQPGRLAQGPDEKCGMTGRTPGVLLMALSFQIEAPRWGGVARRRK